MPGPEPNRSRLVPIGGLLVLLALCGCEPAPSVTDPVTQRPPPPRIEAPVPTAPAPLPDPADAMAGASYEVAIASTAANRKRALEECELRPDAEHENCIDQVEADWEVTRSTVDDLRGEQQ